MAEMEISKEHHHDDNDDGNKNNDDKKMKKIIVDEDESSKSSSRKRKASDDDDHGGGSSSSSQKPKEEVVNKAEEVSCIPNVMLDMPRDIMVEVSMQLPPSSVMRAIFASKLWYETITDLSFLRNHASRFHCFDKEPPGLLICPTHTDDKHPVYALLPDQLPNENLLLPPLRRLLDEFLPTLTAQFPTSVVVDSCNGLILYCESRIANEHVTSNSRPNVINIFICNPVLNQYKFITPPPIDLVPIFKNPESVRIKGYPHLLFDPSLSLSFKVVVILNEIHSSEFHLLVYSSETGEWKYLNQFPHDEKLVEYWESVMFHGIWYCVRDNDILCLNANDDSISFIDLPQIPDEHSSRDVYYFGECAGRLQLIQGYDTEDQWFPFKMIIKEMEVLDQLPITGTNWIEKGNFIIDAAAAGYEEEEEEVNRAIKVMHIYKRKTEEQAEEILLNMNNQRFVSFNLTTETFGNEIIIPHLENSNNIEAFPFAPTLFPLDVVTRF